VRCVWWNASGNPSGTAYVDGWQLNVGDQIPAFQDFTAYSFNWMPEKIETVSTTQIAWSSSDFTTILELSFECESTMMCLIFSSCHFQNQPNYQMDWQVTLDDVTLDSTFQIAGDILYIAQGTHFVKIVEKGSHTLKLQMRRASGSGVIYATTRRLTILKSFYRGGTT